MRGLFNLICSLFFSLLIYPHTGLAEVDLPWSTTFDCNEWTQSDGLDKVNCDGITGAGGWTCNGLEEQITSEANYHGGFGGKGQRHWVGDGKNVNSGSLHINFSLPQHELWIRWYMRYEFGFKWGFLGYDKLLYIPTNASSAVIPIFYGKEKLSIGCQATGGPPHFVCTNFGWNTIMGGPTSDGKWHCYEIHIKMDTNGSNGIGEWWVDGVRKMSHKNVNYGSGTGATGWIRVGVGGNQNSPANGRSMYVDFDDIAISDTGYIGPIPHPAAPTGLRILTAQ